MMLAALTPLTTGLCAGAAEISGLLQSPLFRRPNSETVATYDVPRIESSLFLAMPGVSDIQKEMQRVREVQLAHPNPEARAKARTLFLIHCNTERLKLAHLFQTSPLSWEAEAGKRIDFERDFEPIAISVLHSQMSERHAEVLEHVTHPDLAVRTLSYHALRLLLPGQFVFYWLRHGQDWVKQAQEEDSAVAQFLSLSLLSDAASAGDHRAYQKLTEISGSLHQFRLATSARLLLESVPPDLRPPQAIHVNEPVTVTAGTKTVNHSETDKPFQYLVTPLQQQTGLEPGVFECAADARELQQYFEGQGKDAQIVRLTAQADMLSHYNSIWTDSSSDSFAYNKEHYVVIVDGQIYDLHSILPPLPLADYLMRSFPKQRVETL